MVNQALNFILGRIQSQKHQRASIVDRRGCNAVHPLQDKSMLFTDLIDEWFCHHKYKIMESTAYNYAKSMPFVKNYFGGIHINNITPEMIYDYVAYLKNSDLAISSARVYFKIVQLSFNYALMYHYATYNPVTEITFPKPARVEVKPFSEAEFNLLMTANAPDWVKNGVVIAFRTGMRPGEIYALKWSDVNLEQHYISVQCAISRASSTATLKTTKTPTGVRRIDIDSKLTALLSNMRKCYPSETYVFPGVKYGYRVPWNLAAEVRKMCEEVGIPPRNFYSLRHTHASVLMSHGVHPKIVQERLGHSSCKITLDTYSHVAPTIQRAAVDVMEDI